MTTWGPAPVCEEIRRRLAAELGVELQQPKTLVRVYGYGPSFGLNACDEGSYAQQEMRRVWPSEDVRMITCQHITKSGLQRPTFSLALEGVPMDWEQSTLRESDARLRQKVWVRCVTKQDVGPRKHVGPGTRVVRGPRQGASPDQELATQEPWRPPGGEAGNDEMCEDSAVQVDF